MSDLGDATDLEQRLLRLPPSLVLLSGLPATGKSWIGRRIALALGGELLSSDTKRIELFGPRRPDEPRGPYDQGRYSAEAKQRVYDLLLADARRAISQGKSAIVDGSFLQRAWREPFVALAAELKAPFCMVETVADEATVKRRLEARAHDPHEASEADWEVYQKLSKRVEPPVELAERQRMTVDTGTALGEVLGRLCENLEPVRGS